MGGKFIIGAIIVGGGFKGILVLMHSGLWKNNLNIFLPKASLVVSLLLVSFVTSFSNQFFGICGHPFSMTQSSVSNTFTITFWVLNNVLTFPSSSSSCVLFGVPVVVDCWISSLGEPFVFSTVVYTIVISTSSSMGWSTS